VVSKHWRRWGSVTLVAVLAWRLDWRQVGSAFAALDARLWLAAVGVYLLAQLASSFRWLLLARVLGLSGGPGRYLAYYFIGMFFNLVLPTSVGGDVVRAWYLARQAGPEPPTGRKTAAVLSVLADRANGLAVLMVVACLGLAFYPVALPAWLTATVLGMGAAALAGLALLPALPYLRPWLPQRPAVQQVVDGTVLYLRHGKVLAVVTALSLFVQLASVVLVWLVGRGLGLAVPFPYYCILMSVVAVLTLLPVSVNGMGLREAGTVLLLAPLGVGEAQAVTLSILSFAVQAAASLGGSVVYLFGRFPRFVDDGTAKEDETPSALRLPQPAEVLPHAQPVGGDPDQGRARKPQAAA
jgi:uncharacterized membrane protein YbhN (UPF0104 family)